MLDNIRERPICRKQILEFALRPHLGPTGKWDERFEDPGGEVGEMSDGMRKQMRLMISQGVWKKNGRKYLPVGHDRTDALDPREDFNGVRVLPMKNAEFVHDEGGIQVLVVRPNSPIDQRRKATKVASVANWEVQADFGLYEPNGADRIVHKKHVLLACNGNRAVGFLMFRICGERERWTVFYIWVAKNHRRRGIGSMLIGVAAKLIGVPVSDLAFFGPFSESGAALLEAVAPNADGFRL
jgi:hypothetical protein